MSPRSVLRKLSVDLSSSSINIEGGAVDFVIRAWIHREPELRQRVVRRHRLARPVARAFEDDL